MARVTAPRLAMTPGQRRDLEAIAGAAAIGRRKSVQARALLLAGTGVGTNEIARRCHTTSDSVRAWRRRFGTEGVDSVGRIRPGRGRTSWLPVGTAAAVVHDTLHERPDDGAKRWTTRLMAERFGIGKDTVARIWRDHEISPWKGGGVMRQDEQALDEARRDEAHRDTANRDEATRVQIDTAPGPPPPGSASRR
ncbi:MAG TPA: helix-turn-helix domain-containing protein [Acidimicrobiales bacterium]|nr:helix-turn-helix domain-containing protein [Acidimicrobiales bacterium]